MPRCSPKRTRNKKKKKEKKRKRKKKKKGKRKRDCAQRWGWGEENGIRRDGDTPRGEFPGGLMVRVRPFHGCSPGSIPGLGTENHPETYNSRNCHHL